MGLGDAKLMAAVGFWFGWASIPFVIFISSVVALVIVIPSLVNKTKSMKAQIPFGPYIIIGCLIYVSFANQIKYFILTDGRRCWALMTMRSVILPMNG